jgi:putative ABC transport system substrate-binding protein
MLVCRNLRYLDRRDSPLSDKARWHSQGRNARRSSSAGTNQVQAANGGMIVVGGPLPQRHRDLIIALTARTKLPTVYFERSFVTAGGLASYGANETDQYRRAASYVDRILRGEKPADLPVQAPTKYELVMNLKTAKTLGLAISPALLATADVVIE